MSKSDTLPQNGLLRRIRRASWPNVEGLESAKAAVNLGVYASFLCGIATTILAILSGMAKTSVKGFDIYCLADAFIFFALGVGIWRMSRVCALAALILYVAERVESWTDEGVRNPLMFGIFSCLLREWNQGYDVLSEAHCCSRCNPLDLAAQVQLPFLKR